MVTGQRLDKAGTVITLDADALARQGATDMQNMARYAPLVSVPGAVTALLAADIERQAHPGRYAGIILKLVY